MMGWLSRFRAPDPPEDEDVLKAKLDALDYEISLRLEMLRTGTLILERKAEDSE